jgi:hypothetical protein
MTKQLINQSEDQTEKEIAFLEEQRALRIGSRTDDQVIEDVTASLARLGAYFECPDKSMIVEFCSVFKLAFPNMSATEIRAAIRLNEAGKLGDNDDKRIFYGRKFSISSMMAILHAYNDNYRKEMVSVIIARQEAVKLIQDQQERKEKMSDLFEVERQKFLNGEFECTSWKNVKDIWFDIAENEGLIIYKDDKQKRKIWNDAKTFAAAEISKINADARVAGKIGEIITTDFEEKMRLKSIVIARKIAVFRIVIEKEI